MKVEVLRVAAYFLIAHFMLMLGLAAVGQGTPEYAHLGVALALLVVSCTALFSPRKHGWLAVVGYAIVVLPRHVFGIWAIWDNAAIPLGTKVGAIVVMMVIDSLLVAALALVLVNIAAFATPAAARAATQEQPGRG